MGEGNTIVVLFAVFVSLGGFIFGYDIGYISGILEMPTFQNDFCNGTTCESSRSGILVSILSLGTLAGALFGTPVADFIGRKGAIIAMTLIYMVGVIVQLTTTGSSIRNLLAGRFVAGMGVGALSALVPMYQGETAPKHLRGTMIACYQVFITAGIEVAYCVDYGTRHYTNSASYRIPIGLQLLWGLILAIGGFWLPESPRYLLSKGRYDDALKSVATVRSTTVDDPEVVADIDEMRGKIVEEQKNTRNGWVECFLGKPKIGYRTTCGIILQMLQQLTGASTTCLCNSISMLTGLDFFFYYGTTVFSQIGVTDPFVVQMIFGAIDFWCTLPGLWYFERFGRRRTLIVGGFIMFVCYYIYAIVGFTAVNPDGSPTYSGGIALTVFACFFVFGYASSWGPGTWILTGELFPTHVRAKCISLSVSSNWIWNFLVGYFSPTITDKIGTKYGFVFGSCCAIGILFIFFFIPETRGLSLESMDELWDNLWTTGLKPWQTHNWQPSISYADKQRHERSYSDDRIKPQAEHIEHDSNV
ncbi:protein of unknown function [Taphrina deformans PYCC 5710]|uniref:Major facilitator superfamily (MFS) profile domain-containing protein n=1 Tax=Taphrina deformans (strain PYCC 5710 / ATCC 11124 / CBS 356.35 / IMI 108563 / JCM 9778 / NBRC 8474) TaxID=1097556 RepID=R4XKI3_TAPDE|nr:protein of unknown function [Taphrina deformans PYCC 5710]|eukprot:CCG84964.1 protein of unknown function [Taphrina deformans PYCC 5710]